MTKTKTPPIYGDDLPITAFQIKEIRKNSNFEEDIKEEWVQWVTGDVNRTSLKSLTQAQAIKIIRQQTGSTDAIHRVSTDNYASFDKTNPQHKLILSLCRQAQWTTPNDKYGEVADLDRLSDFLKSDKSPVRKPLLKMSSVEVKKVITALSGIVKSRYK